MTEYLVAITILNIILASSAVAYAVWQVWDYLVQTAQLAQKLAEHPSTLPAPTSCDQGAAVTEIGEEAVVDDDKAGLLPEEWLDELRQEGIAVGSLLEATSQVLRLRVDDYRDKLVALEQCAQTVDDSSLLESLIVEFQEFNKSWLSQLEEVGNYFMDHRDDLTETKEAAEALELVVLNSNAQTETTCSNLSMYKFTDDLAVDRRFVLQDLYLVIDSVHHLRDCAAETLLQVPSEKFGITTERTDVPGDYRRLVAAIEQWRSRSDKGSLNLAQLDVDRFAASNHRHGTQMGDLVADRIRLLIEDLLQDGGMEVPVVRLGGAKYFALIEGATYRDSIQKVETVRQAVELTTFQTEMDELTFTLSAAIVRGKVHEPATEQLIRLDSFAREAKKSAGNRTMMEEDSKPVLAKSTKTHVEPRDVSLAPALLAT